MNTPTIWSRGTGFGSLWLDCICEGSEIVARVLGTGYPTGKGWSPESERRARLVTEAPALTEALRKAQGLLRDLESPAHLEEGGALDCEISAILARIDGEG